MDVGVNKYRVVIMTHQTLSLEKYWKLFPATLHFSWKNPFGFPLKVCALLHVGFLSRTFAFGSNSEAMRF